MGDLVIGIPIYGGVDLIDVAVPVDVLSRIPHYWSGGAVQLMLVAALRTLESYANVTVANGYPRWVECGNRFTTGGVSASLDGALKLAEILTGDAQVARCIQLEIQYRPSPPFDCGDPAVADFRTYDLVVGRSVKEC